MTRSSVGSTNPGSSGGRDANPATIVDAVRTRLAASEETRFGFGGQWWSLAELDETADRYARRFRDLGVGEGDRIATLMPNRVEFMLTWLASMKIGAILTSVNTALRDSWLLHVLNDAAPSLAIVDPEMSDRINEISPQLELPVRVVVTDTEEFAAMGRGDRIERAFEPRAETPVLIIYTSGTTGRSKGCVVSHGYLLNYARLRDASMPRQCAETALTALPLFHAAGIGVATTTLVRGGSAYFMQRFSVGSFWPEVEASGATYVSLIGAMVPMLAQAPDNEAAKRCFGQVRVLSGSPSADVNATIKARFGVQHTDMHFFGQTEACPIVSSSTVPYRAGTSGYPNDSFEIAIVDSTDTPVPAGEIGQLVCRPTRPNVMFSGYWRSPDATLARSTTLWWHTGDFGSIDEDGYFCFADRGDDRIRRGGENVSSFEVEAVVGTHPEIAAVAAIATPSELGEDEVKLVVLPIAGATITPPELSAWCTERMPRFANPRFIEFVTELPMTPTGKIQKHVLRGAGRTDGTWDREAGATPTVSDAS